VSRRDPEQWDKIENLKTILFCSALLAADLVAWVWLSQKLLGAS
tara:strand:- start:2130 stop:2261 length:132 start_codon:yes stop_codon:yes gene_type:complete